MANFSIIDCVNTINKPFILEIADKGLTPFRIALQGRIITITPKENIIQNKVYSMGLRVLAGCVATMILPLTLAALGIKWWKQGEWQQTEKPIEKQAIVELEEEKLIEIEEEEPLRPTRIKFVDQMANNLLSIQQLDVKLGEPVKGWRVYGKEHGESNQKFQEYIKCCEQAEWPDRRPLHVQRIGIFTRIDLKIITLVCDYLHVLYGIPIHLQESILTMTQLKERYLQMMEEAIDSLQTEEDVQQAKAYQRQFEENFPRKNGQYNVNTIFDLMKAILQPEIEGKKNQIIVLTSNDLYADKMQNFVFGAAAATDGVGCWSNSRIGNPQKNKQALESCVKRMLKIVAHEFGHMRGLPHCTDYACNMGGSMSLEEADHQPLLNCAQDMAKIAYLTKTSLLKLHENVLKFFKGFNEKYELNVNFTEEITTLNARIRILKLQEDKFIPVL